jgi:hypothetical protein
MSEDWKKLRELAEAATPGPWKHRQVPHPNGEVHYDTVRDCYGGPVAYDSDAHEADFREQDAAFIAAANPQAVIALLDALRGAKAVRDTAVRLYDQLGEELEQIVGGDGTSLDRLRRLEQQLAAITAARDEACDIAGRRLECNYGHLAHHSREVGERIATLRLVGTTKEGV